MSVMIPFPILKGEEAKEFKKRILAKAKANGVSLSLAKTWAQCALKSRNEIARACRGR